MLQAIATRLASAHLIFSYGEQDRLAFAIASLVNRKDFDAAAFQQWLSTLDEVDRGTWKTSPPDDNMLKAFENNNYLLQALQARLSSAPSSSLATAVSDQVSKVLQNRQ